MDPHVRRDLELEIANEPPGVIIYPPGLVSLPPKGKVRQMASANQVCAHIPWNHCGQPFTYLGEFIP
jgi:hypothetical protein